MHYIYLSLFVVYNIDSKLQILVSIVLVHVNNILVEVALAALAKNDGCLSSTVNSELS